MSTLTPPPLPQQLFFAAGAPAKELYHDPIIPPDAYAIAFPRPNWDAIRGTLTVDAFTGIKRGYHYIQDVTKEVQDCKRHKEELGTTITKLNARMAALEEKHTGDIEQLKQASVKQQQTIQRLQQTVEELQQTSADQQQTIEELKQTIKAKEQDLKKTSKDLQKQKKRIAELQTTSTEQQKTIEEVNADLENLRDLVQKHAEPLYRAVNG